jgi:hypothetical protein
MQKKYQRGELSLFWAAVFVGVVTVAGMATLFSMRYERNVFAEALSSFNRTSVGQFLQQTKQTATQSIAPDAAAIRKCTVNGKVVYSNVECDGNNTTSHKVELHDTRGFEAPKAPVASASQEVGAPNLRDKLVDKAVQK